MKKAAIAVLANQGHLEMTKHIIYTSYVFGNWKGDYILLAHQIENQKDLKWFIERGIHIIPVNKNVNVDNLYSPETSIYYSKLRLFHTDCRKWDSILYLDTDMIVQWDLNTLVKKEGFAAAYDCARFPLIHQFSPKDRALNDEEKNNIYNLLKDYQLNLPAFNAGLLLIDSKNNSEKRYKELLSLAEKFKDISTYGDQGILNLYFQNKFKPLPYVYNDFFQSDDFNRNSIIKRNSDKDAVILHLTYPYKPWNPKSSYYKRWIFYSEQSELLFDIKQKGQILPKWRLWRTEFINMFNQYRVGIRKWK